MRILALDVGEKNIGLAISDRLGWVAQGLPSLRCETKNKSICAVAEIVKQKRVSEIVVGMPINLDGTTGKKAKEIAEFVAVLRKRLTLPIKLWDERLTSVQAERILLQADVSRKRRKEKLDRLAAQIILQSYLDSKSRSQGVSKDNSK